MNDFINSSIFDLFKVGPGPSSSHTIGPMRAAALFLQRGAAANLKNVPASLEVRLCGSLAATGQGHGSNRAVAAGLLGEVPENCNTERLNGLLSDETVYQADFGKFCLNFDRHSIIFDFKTPCLKFQNTMFMRLLDSAGTIMFELVVYSTGGGTIVVEGEDDNNGSIAIPPYRFRNMDGILRLSAKYELSIAEIMVGNEQVISELSKVEINDKIDNLIVRMLDSVERGIVADGVLPGPIGLHRKGGCLYRNSKKMKFEHERFLAQLNAWALAASEENAAGNLIVTAPTSGAAGVIPAVVKMLRETYAMSDEKLRIGMLTAGAVGMIARRNASISGAEVGCQGEIGVASAMAAAMIAAVHATPSKVVECAAEIALEHHLGLTCDPVYGYVQIPCIERNAVGAVTAYNAYLLATAGNSVSQKISFDEVVAAMLETGQRMCSDLKETSRGGLARHSLCE